MKCPKCKGPTVTCSLFTSSYERCYRCEPLKGSQKSVAQKPNEKRLWPFGIALSLNNKEAIPLTCDEIREYSPLSTSVASRLYGFKLSYNYSSFQYVYLLTVGSSCHEVTTFRSDSSYVTTVYVYHLGLSIQEWAAKVTQQVIIQNCFPFNWLLEQEER